MSFLRFSGPFWLVGFRPFFTLAMLAGAVLPLLWVLLFAGRLSLPAGGLTPVQWHAHEMFFGFGWAVLGGFLLTASKNWVNVRGHHGRLLALLALAWLIERLAVWQAGNLPGGVFWLANLLFMPGCAAAVLWTLLQHRATDSYPDNPLFYLVLPAFLAAKAMLLLPDLFAHGVSVSLGLFRMAFLIMLERTVTAFMKGAFQVVLWRHALLERVIKGLGLLLVVQSVLPAGLAAGAAVLLAALLLLRWVRWQPLRGLKRIEIGVMYLGYLAILGQLLLLAGERLNVLSPVGSASVHLFTFGAMGLIIPAMLLRIARGHTGRKVAFDPVDRALLWLMLLALVARVLAPQLAPALYLRWVDVAAACWALVFGVLAWRLIPMLLQPRVDGREH